MLLLPNIIPRLDEATTIPYISLRRGKFYMVCSTAVAFGYLYSYALFDILDAPILDNIDNFIQSTPVQTDVVDRSFTNSLKLFLRFLVAYKSEFQILLLPFDLFSFISLITNIGPIRGDLIKTQIAQIVGSQRVVPRGTFSVIGALISTIIGIYRVVSQSSDFISYVEMLSTDMSGFLPLDILIVAKAVLLMTPFWISSFFYETVDELKQDFYNALVSAREFLELLFDALHFFFVNILFSGFNLNELLINFFDFSVNMLFKALHAFYIAAKFLFRAFIRSVFITTGIDLSNFDYVLRGLALPVLSNAFEAVNTTVSDVWLPALKETSSYFLKKVFFSSNFILSATLIAINIICSGYILGVYRLLNIGSFDLAQFKRVVRVLRSLVEYSYNVEDKLQNARFEELFPKDKLQPELVILSKYLSPVLPQPTLLKVLYESLVNAYLSLILTPYSTFSNKVVNPLDYMQKLAYSSNLKPEDSSLITPGDVAASGTDVNSALLSILLPSHVVISPNANGTTNYSASDTASDLLNKGPFLRPGASETRAPKLHDSRKTGGSFGNSGILSDALKDIKSDVLKMYVMQNNSTQPLLNTSEFKTSGGLVNAPFRNVKVVTQDPATLDAALAKPGSRLHYVPNYRASTEGPENGGALLNVKHRITHGLTSAGVSIGAKYISSKITFQNESVPLLDYKRNSDSILNCQSQISLACQLNIMIAYLTMMNVNAGNSFTFETLRHFSQAIHLINYWTKTKHLPASGTPALVDERTVFLLIQKNGLNRVKLDKFIKGYILYLKYSEKNKLAHHPRLPVLFFMILNQLEETVRDAFLDYFSEVTYRTNFAESSYPVVLAHSSNLANSFNARTLLTGTQVPTAEFYLPTLAVGVATIEQKVNFLLQLVKHNISLSNLLNYKTIKTNSLRRYAGLVSASNDYKRIKFPKTLLTNETNSNSSSLDIMNMGDLFSASMLNDSSTVADVPYWLDHSSELELALNGTADELTYLMNNATHRPAANAPNLNLHSPHIVKIDGNNGILVDNQKNDVYTSPAGIGADFVSGSLRRTNLQLVARMYQQASNFMDLKHIEENADVRNLLNAAYRAGVKIKKALVEELLLASYNKSNILNKLVCWILGLFNADTDTKLTFTKMISNLTVTCFKFVYTASFKNDVMKTTSFTDNLMSGSRIVNLNNPFNSTQPSMIALYELSTATKLNKGSSTMVKTDTIVPLFTSRILHNHMQIDPSFTATRDFHEAHLLQHLLNKKTAHITQITETSLDAEKLNILFNGFLLFADPIDFVDLHIIYATNSILAIQQSGSSIAVAEPMLSKDNANVINVNLQGIISRLSRARLTGVVNQGNSTMVSSTIVQPGCYSGLKLLFEIFENETIYKLNRSVIYSRIKVRNLLLSTILKSTVSSLREMQLAPVVWCFKGYIYFLDLSSPMLALLNVGLLRVFNPDAKWLDIFLTTESINYSVLCPLILAIFANALVEFLIHEHLVSAKNVFAKLIMPNSGKKISNIVLDDFSIFTKVLYYLEQLLGLNLLSILVASTSAAYGAIANVNAVNAGGLALGGLGIVKTITDYLKDYRKTVSNAGKFLSFSLLGYSIPVILTTALLNILLTIFLTGLSDEFSKDLTKKIYKKLKQGFGLIFKLLNMLIFKPIHQLTGYDFDLLWTYIKNYNIFSQIVKLILKTVLNVSKSVSGFMQAVILLAKEIWKPLKKQLTDLHEDAIDSPLGDMYRYLYILFCRNQVAKSANILATLVRYFKKAILKIYVRFKNIVQSVIKSQSYQNKTFLTQVTPAGLNKTGSFNAQVMQDAEEIVSNMESSVFEKLEVAAPIQSVKEEINKLVGKVYANSQIHQIPLLFLLDLYSLYPQYIMESLSNYINSTTPCDTRYRDLTKSEKEKGNSKDKVLGTADVKKAQSNLKKRIALKGDVLKIIFARGLVKTQLCKMILRINAQVLEDLEDLPPSMKYESAATYHSKLFGAYLDFCKDYNRSFILRLIGTKNHKNATVLLAHIMLFSQEYDMKYALPNFNFRIHNKIKYLFAVWPTPLKTIVTVESMLAPVVLVVLPGEQRVYCIHRSYFERIFCPVIKYGSFPKMHLFMQYYRVFKSGGLEAYSAQIKEKNTEARTKDAENRIRGISENSETGSQNLRDVRETKARHAALKEVFERRIQISARIVHIILHYKFSAISEYVTQLTAMLQQLESINIQFADLLTKLSPAASAYLESWRQKQQTVFRENLKTVKQIIELFDQSADFEKLSRALILMFKKVGKLLRPAYLIHEDLYNLVSELRSKDFNLWWTLLTNRLGYSKVSAWYALTTNNITNSDILKLIMGFCDNDYILRLSEIATELTMSGLELCSEDELLPVYNCYNYLQRRASNAIDGILDLSGLYFEGDATYDQLSSQCLDEALTEAKYMLPTISFFSKYL